MRTHKLSALSSNPTVSRRSPKLYAAVREHGWKSFQQEIIASCRDLEDALISEVACIAQDDTFQHGLNSSPGGVGFAHGDAHPMKRFEIRSKTRGDKHYLRRDPIALERHRQRQASADVRANKAAAQNQPNVRAAKSRNVSRSKSTLTDAEARHIKELLRSGYRICDVVRQTSIPRSKVARIAQGKTYTWIE